jgi:hypothetical protein
MDRSINDLSGMPQSPTDAHDLTQSMHRRLAGAYACEANLAIGRACQQWFNTELYGTETNERFFRKSKWVPNH